MARLRGRAPRGERLRAGVPHGHWRTTTFVSGLRLSGIDAPMLIDGAINGESFLAMSSRCSSRRCAPATSSSLRALLRASLSGIGSSVC